MHNENFCSYHCLYTFFFFFLTDKAAGKGPFRLSYRQEPKEGQPVIWSFIFQISDLKSVIKANSGFYCLSQPFKEWRAALSKAIKSIICSELCKIDLDIERETRNNYTSSPPSCIHLVPFQAAVHSLWHQQSSPAAETDGTSSLTPARFRRPALYIY